MTNAFFAIRAGELIHKSAIKKAFDGLKDGAYELTITRKSKRSLPQNRYYFGVCVNMVKEALHDLGHDISLEETHEWMKSKFNYTEIVNTNTGEVERVPRSTTELSKEDFGAYIEKIQQFAAEFLNIIIPDAGTQMTLDYEPANH